MAAMKWKLPIVSTVAVATMQQRTGHDGLSNSEPNWMWMCGKFVTIGAGRMFFNGLVDNRTKAYMTRIVMFAYLAGGDRVLESVVMVEASLVALLTHKLVRTDSRIRALSFLLNLS
jgi:hypothetical protein